MTNRLALLIGLAIVTAVAVDLMLYGTAHVIFLGKKMLDLIDWIAFWR